MYQYIIRRIIVFFPMLISLSIIVFGLSMAAPGDAISGKILDPDADPKVFEQHREELGLNQPVPVQYVKWVHSFIQGDFGKSMVYKGRTVQSLIQERFANTLYLGVVALTRSEERRVGKSRRRRCT